MGMLNATDKSCIQKFITDKYDDWSVPITIRNYTNKGTNDMFNTAAQAFTDDITRGLVRDAEYLRKNKRLDESVQHTQSGLLEKAEKAILFYDQDISLITLTKQSTLIEGIVEYTIIGFIDYESEKLCLVTKNGV